MAAVPSCTVVNTPRAAPVTKSRTSKLAPLNTMPSSSKRCTTPPTGRASAAPSTCMRTARPAPSAAASSPDPLPTLALVKLRRTCPVTPDTDTWSAPPPRSADFWPALARSILTVSDLDNVEPITVIVASEPLKSTTCSAVPDRLRRLRPEAAASEPSVTLPCADRISTLRTPANWASVKAVAPVSTMASLPAPPFSVSVACRSAALPLMASSLLSPVKRSAFAVRVKLRATAVGPLPSATISAYLLAVSTRVAREESCTGVLVTATSAMR